MANFPPPDKINCLVCREWFNVTKETADSLPNNLFALHIFYLDTERDQRIAEIPPLKLQIAGLHAKIKALEEAALARAPHNP